MEKLEKKLNYFFQDISILDTALTHSSYANENKKNSIVCNERLEFLGDSILSLIVAEYLYKNDPNMPEGIMTRRRAELVCEQSLVSVAAKLKLGDYLHLGHGEEQGGGRNRPSILADAVEAILAAVYLDGGPKPVERIINQYILSPNEENGLGVCRDYKTILQELVQKKNGQILSYHLIEESGPDHMKIFLIEVCLNGSAIGEGQGKSKKEAEQSAARHALEALTK